MDNKNFKIINKTSLNTFKKNDSTKDKNILKDIPNIIEVKEKFLVKDNKNEKEINIIKNNKPKINNQKNAILLFGNNEEKKNIKNINKTNKNLNIETDNSYYSDKENFSKKILINNYRKNLNLKKINYETMDSNYNMENNSELILNSFYNTPNNINRQKSNKKDLNNSLKKYDKINSNIIINDYNFKNKKEIDGYITENQNNKNKRKKLYKKNSNFINYKRSNSKKRIENEDIYNKKNDINENLTSKKKYFFFNNDNNKFEEINNFDEGNIKIIKINNFINNSCKNSCNTTIQYFPNNFYFDNKPKKILNKKIDDFEKINENQKINKELIKETINNLNLEEIENNLNYNKSNTSLNYLKNNTINNANYNKSKINFFSEQDSRNTLPISANINYLNNETQTLYPSEQKLSKKYFYQNTDSCVKDCLENDSDITSEKLKCSKNKKINHNIRIKRDNLRKKIFNDNNFNKNYTENKENNNIKYIENKDNLYYKKKIRNKCLLKTKTMNNLFNDKFISQNLAERRRLFTTKDSYNDLNELKKSTKNEQNDDQIITKKLSFSKDKMLNNINKKNDFDELNFNIQKNSKIIKINKNNTKNNDNFNIKKKNFISKTSNDKILSKHNENNFTKNNTIEHYSKDKKILTSSSVKKDCKKKEEFTYKKINTGRDIFEEKKAYFKPIKVESNSKSKGKNDTLIKEKLKKSKYSKNNINKDNISLNYSIESINQDNTKNNSIKKGLFLNKSLLSNYSNYIINMSEFKKNLKDEEKETNNNTNKNNNIFENIDKKNNELNINKIESEIFDYNSIDKIHIHCHYKKFYNYFIKIPIKKICFIQKSKKYKETKVIGFDTLNENQNIDDNKEIIPQDINISFNGKNIIPKNDDFKSKINGIYKVNNFGKDKKYMLPRYKTDLILQKRNNNISLERGTSKVNDTIISNNINLVSHKEKKINKYSKNTSPKINLNNNFNKKGDLSKKISLATNKLNNIFTTKNEFDNFSKRRSITEEKFALGCSKLNKIFRRKSQNNILSLNNILNEQNDSILINQKRVITEENEKPCDNIEISNNKIKKSKKTFTYKCKKRNNVLEDEDNKFEDKEIQKKIEIKNKIINLLNILNMNNLNNISRKILDIIFSFDKNIQKNEIRMKYIENESIFINCIFEKILNDKCDLSVYSQFCIKLNTFLLIELRNYSLIKDEYNNLFDRIVIDFNKKVIDREYFNDIYIEREKTLNSLKKNFLNLINFFSELILSKLITQKDSFNLVITLYDEHEKYDNKVKNIFLLASINLFDSFLKIIFEHQNIDSNVNKCKDFIENKLKVKLQEKNISNNLKNKISKIIERFNEFNINNSQNDNVKDNINDNIIKQIDNLNKFEKNTNTKNKQKIIKEKSKNINLNYINKNMKNELNDHFQEENGRNTINNIDQKVFENKLSIENISIEINNRGRKYYKSKTLINKNSSNLNNIDINNINKQLNHDISDNKNVIEYNKNIKNLDSEIYYSKTITPTNHKKKSKSRKKKKSTHKNKIYRLNKNQENEEIISEEDKIIFNEIKNDFDNYLEFLEKERIKSKNDFYDEINDSYNWKVIDDLITVKKVKLDEIIKIYIKICKNEKDMNKNNIFKANLYIKSIVEYYYTNLSNNQIEILHLNMIEIFMNIKNIVDNNKSELMHEIIGNLLFILLKNKLYYIKDLNNFIDASEETKINISKVVKYTIIASGSYSKLYYNDFKYTKLFNKNSNLFEKYISNELTDIYQNKQCLYY